MRSSTELKGREGRPPCLSPPTEARPNSNLSLRRLHLKLHHHPRHQLLVAGAVVNEAQLRGPLLNSGQPPTKLPWLRQPPVIRWFPLHHLLHIYHTPLLHVALYTTSFHHHHPLGDVASCPWGGQQRCHHLLALTWTATTHHHLLWRIPRHHLLPRHLHLPHLALLSHSASLVLDGCHLSPVVKNTTSACVLLTLM